MNEKSWLRVPNPCSDNRKPVLSPLTSLRIGSVERGATLNAVANSKQFQMTQKQKECRVTSVKGRGIFPSTPDPSILAPFGPRGLFRYSNFGFCLAGVMGIKLC